MATHLAVPALSAVASSANRERAIPRSTITAVSAVAPVSAISTFAGPSCSGFGPTSITAVPTVARDSVGVAVAAGSAITASTAGATWARTYAAVGSVSTVAAHRAAVTAGTTVPSRAARSP